MNDFKYDNGWRPPDGAKILREADTGLARRLGMPAGVRVIQTKSMHASADGRHAGLVQEQLGVVVKELPNPCPWPVARLTRTDGTVLLVQVWRRTLAFPPSLAFLELLWHPDRGMTIALRGLEGIWTMTEAKRILEAHELLLTLDPRVKTLAASAARQRTRRAREDRAVALRAAGLTASQIARELGMGDNEDGTRQVFDLLAGARRRGKGLAEGVLTLMDR